MSASTAGKNKTEKAVRERREDARAGRVSMLCSGQSSRDSDVFSWISRRWDTPSRSLEEARSRLCEYCLFWFLCYFSVSLAVSPGSPSLKISCFSRFLFFFFPCELSDYYLPHSFLQQTFVGFRCAREILSGVRAHQFSLTSLKSRTLLCLHYLQAGLRPDTGRLYPLLSVCHPFAGLLWKTQISSFACSTQRPAVTYRPVQAKLPSWWHSGS